MFLRCCVMLSIEASGQLRDPRRLVGHVGLVDVRTEERSDGGGPDMSRRGCRRSVHGVRGEQHEERLAGRRAADRLHGDAGEHVGRVVGRVMTVRRLRAIGVPQPVVEVRPVALGERVPGGPSRRHVSDRGAVVAVEILADQDGAVASLLQPHREGAVLEAGRVEGGPPSGVRDVIAAPIRPNTGRMGEQAREQRGPGGATHRGRDHAVGYRVPSSRIRRPTASIQSIV